MKNIILFLAIISLPIINFAQELPGCNDFEVANIQMDNDALNQLNRT